MARVDLTYKQVLAAAQQLPPVQQQNLVQALSERPGPIEVGKLANRLRPKFRLNARKRRRMDRLVEKRSAGTLLPNERAELDALIREIDENTLKMADALVQAVERTAPRVQSVNGGP